MAPQKKETAPQVEAALEEFDLSEWLNGTTSPKDTITVYRDGEALKNLQKLTAYIESVKGMDEKRKSELVGSIADDPDADALDDNVTAEIEAMRERAKATSLTFELEGLAPSETALIEKKVAKHFKGQKDEDGNEYKDGAEHPDYPLALANAYISRSIIDTMTPDGKSVKKKWTEAEVEQLRYNPATGKGLPGMEFNRLEGKVISVVYMRYDVDTLIDQDFS